MSKNIVDSRVVREIRAGALRNVAQQARQRGLDSWDGAVERELLVLAHDLEQEASELERINRGFEGLVKGIDDYDNDH